LTDESYIKLALEIAKKGVGNVSPNPLVGCIIVKEGRIIGAGFHEKYGENHAEINAIESAIEDVAGSTLYVNLEPCCHYGKTPPCVNALIEKKIKRVVIGTLDMNPKVSGKGGKILMDAGIEVKVGVLENECISLNKFFFKYISKGLPYVTIKAAQTLDGKIADIYGDSKWITSVQSRRFVHKLRAKYDAVIVGSNTVLIDKPRLTVRFTEGRNPKKVILDTNLKIPPNHKVYSLPEDEIFIVASKKNSVKKKLIEEFNAKGIKILLVPENADGTLNLRKALRELAKHQINSALVEGGSMVFSSFIKSGLYDELNLFISPKILGDGLSVFSSLPSCSIRKAAKLKLQNVERFGDDVMLELIK
jgi:diaminohydroxyphosphoribosylaminopyrimidine deaminase / 5-amino-6-(5-phosphoribosylamino)uracil reductase